MVTGNLEALAFPKLDATQIAALARCTEAPLTTYEAGRTLFDVGDRDFRFFVIESGEVEIRDHSGETPTVVRVHGPGEFTGDVSHLTGTVSVVSAVARTDCRVYEISPERLRQVLNRRPDLGDAILQAFIARRQLLRESATFAGLRVIGSRYSRDTFRVREFLAKNRVPFSWLDLETDPAVNRLLARFGLGHADTPVVAYGGRLVLRNPSNRELAEVLGIRRPLDRTVYDLAIIGAGPAGLAAAVYGSSEGLRTIVLERTAPGGQAGRSMRIENYLGFPTGITGSELADRAVLQANKFGAFLEGATPVVGLDFDASYAVVRVDGGTVVAKCLLIATGADYRRLDVEGCVRFEGTGVYYAATFNEAQICRGADVAVVGGGNAAGQAAVFLAAQARRVYLLVRGSDLSEHMSAYLARRIEETENIEVLLDTTVERIVGDESLRGVEVRHTTSGARRMLDVTALFSFIGAVPRTEWLPKAIELDATGFVCTGLGVRRAARSDAQRDPFLLESSVPGVFAAGDVRSGSVKRVASAVGEGAMAVQLIHVHLKQR
jgi:thioredoxin reductase (NADPH)